MNDRHPTMHKHATARRRARPAAAMAGAGLIEVMVAVLILAIGLLGIAAMQASALRNSQSALERSQGTINSYAIIDAMRGNLDDARAGAYNIARTCALPADTGTLAASDIAFWLTNLQTDLGEDACGTIACAAGRCVVTVDWDDRRGSGGVEGHEFVTEVVL